MSQPQRLAQKLDPYVFLKPNFLKRQLIDLCQLKRSVPCHFQPQGSAHQPEGGTRDAMSLCNADTSFPDLLGRLSLHYADQASAMQTVPPLCSDRAPTIQRSLFKILVYTCNEIFFFDLVHCIVAARSGQQIWEALVCIAEAHGVREFPPSQPILATALFPIYEVGHLKGPNLTLKTACLVAI